MRPTVGFDAAAMDPCDCQAMARPVLDHPSPLCSLCLPAAVSLRLLPRRPGRPVAGPTPRLNPEQTRANPGPTPGQPRANPGPNPVMAQHLCASRAPSDRSLPPFPSRRPADCGRDSQARGRAGRCEQAGRLALCHVKKSFMHEILSLKYFRVERTLSRAA